MIGQKVRLRSAIVTITGARFKAGALLTVTGTQHPDGYPQRCRVLILHDDRGRILKVFRRSVLTERRRK